MSELLTLEDAKALIALCRAGKLYEIEKWIASGKSIQTPPEVRKNLWLLSIPKMPIWKPSRRIRRRGTFAILSASGDCRGHFYAQIAYLLGESLETIEGAVVLPASAS